MTTKTINLKLQEEADLYSPFDPAQEMIADDVVSHLTRSFQNLHKNNKEEYVLQISCETPLNKETAAENLRNFFAQEIDSVKRSLRQLFWKSLCLAVFGILVLSLWFFLSADSESVNLEILSIVGWVAIWEATSITIMGRHELNQLKKQFDKLLNAEVRISAPANE